MKLTLEELAYASCAHLKEATGKVWASSIIRTAGMIMLTSESSILTLVYRQQEDHWLARTNDINQYMSAKGYDTAVDAYNGMKQGFGRKIAKYNSMLESM